MHTYSIHDDAAYSKLKFRPVSEMLRLLADHAQFYRRTWAGHSRELCNRLQPPLATMCNMEPKVKTPD
jgi:hypothetical protein